MSKTSPATSGMDKNDKRNLAQQSTSTSTPSSEDTHKQILYMFMLFINDGTPLGMWPQEGY